MGRDELLINPLKQLSSKECWHSSVGLEQLICNSSLTSCADFHGVAKRCRYQVFMPFNIRMALRRIAPFCSKILSDRRTDPEKEGLACAREIVLVESRATGSSLL